MDRGAWRATVREVTKIRTGLSDYHFHVLLTMATRGQQSPSNANSPLEWRCLGKILFFLKNLFFFFNYPFIFWLH